MMTVEINGRMCELNFGIGFVRNLDEKYYVESATGTRFGHGLESKVPMLLSGDVLTLAEFIYLGAAGMGDKMPKQQEIDDYIDSAEDIEGLFNMVVDELKKSNACKIKIRALEEELRKAEENLKAVSPKKE